LQKRQQAWEILLSLEEETLILAEHPHLYRWWDERLLKYLAYASDHKAVGFFP